jgi:hypothetical protein
VNKKDHPTIEYMKMIKKENEWNQGALLDQCECGEHHVEITEQSFEWQKRDLWIGELTYLCWQCEAVWMERMWMTTTLSEYKMITKGRDEEE